MISKEEKMRITMEVTEKVRMTFLQNNTESDDDARDIIERELFGLYGNLETGEYRDIIRRVFASTRCRYGILQEYIEDDSVNEIMINGKDDFFTEDNRGIHRVDDCFQSDEELEEIIRTIAAGVHREINELNPILDARLMDGSRVSAVYKNIASGGPVLTIRKFSKDKITMEEMEKRGTITAECADFLRKLVECGYNIFISGGTSSGKTTFLNALSDFIPGRERVIVIEDSAELNLSNISNLVQMECHNANSMGMGEVSMNDLIRASLRMRPDRIIVGEVRGSEVSDMLQAMNTGHDGSMSTGHGNSVSGMLRRMESMYLMGSDIPMDAIRAQIVEGIDIMVHLVRLSDGTRRVSEVRELTGFDGEEYQLNSLFELDSSRNLVRTDNSLKRKERLNMRNQKL